MTTQCSLVILCYLLQVDPMQPWSLADGGSSLVARREHIKAAGRPSDTLARVFAAYPERLCLGYSSTSTDFKWLTFEKVGNR